MDCIDIETAGGANFNPGLSCLDNALHEASPDRASQPGYILPPQGPPGLTPVPSLAPPPPPPPPAPRRPRPTKTPRPSAPPTPSPPLTPPATSAAPPHHDHHPFSDADDDRAQHAQACFDAAADHARPRSFPRLQLSTCISQPVSKAAVLESLLCTWHTVGDSGPALRADVAAGASTPPPTSPPPPICSCTLQSDLNGTCPAVSTIADPCSGTAAGELIGPYPPVCAAVAGSNATPFVYQIKYCPTADLGTITRTCNTSSDCQKGELCVETPNNSIACNLQARVCAVEATAQNCGYTFNGGDVSPVLTGT